LITPQEKLKRGELHGVPKNLDFWGNKGGEVD